MEITAGRRKKKIWRVGNVEGIRLLKRDPGANAIDFSSFDVDGYPDEVSKDDKNAVFTVRWYRECKDDGTVLSSHQNPECNNRYFLPMCGDNALEPVVDVSNHQVIDSVQMAKVHTLPRVSVSLRDKAIGRGDTWPI